MELFTRGSATIASAGKLVDGLNKTCVEPEAGSSDDIKAMYTNLLDTRDTAIAIFDTIKTHKAVEKHLNRPDFDNFADLSEVGAFISSLEALSGQRLNEGIPGQYKWAAVEAKVLLAACRQDHKACCEAMSLQCLEKQIGSQKRLEEAQQGLVERLLGAVSSRGDMQVARARCQDLLRGLLEGFAQLGDGGAGAQLSKDLQTLNTVLSKDTDMKAMVPALAAISAARNGILFAFRILKSSSRFLASAKAAAAETAKQEETVDARARATAEVKDVVFQSTDFISTSDKSITKAAQFLQEFLERVRRGEAIIAGCEHEVLGTPPWTEAATALRAELSEASQAAQLEVWDRWATVCADALRPLLLDKLPKETKDAGEKRVELALRKIAENVEAAGEAMTSCLTMLLGCEVFTDERVKHLGNVMLAMPKLTEGHVTNHEVLSHFFAAAKFFETHTCTVPATLFKGKQFKLFFECVTSRLRTSMVEANERAQKMFRETMPRARPDFIARCETGARLADIFLPFKCKSENLSTNMTAILEDASFVEELAVAKNYHYRLPIYH